MSVQEEDHLLEIANDGGLKNVFETTLTVFWMKVTAEYPVISTTALNTLLPFPTSNLCEAGFSVAIATKPQHHTITHLSLSPIKTKWDRLIAEKHAPGSH